MNWRNAAWFTAGFLMRAMIAKINDLTYDWRYLRAVYQGRGMHYIVKLRGIVWDDGQGEYNVARLPREMNVTVFAEDEEEALEYALSDAADDQGFVIESVESHEIIRGRRRSD